MTSSLTRALLSCLLAAPLSAAPARHPSYEPVPPPASSSSANLLLKATTSASGQWSDRAPGFAVDGKLNPQDHWTCEDLPVWHQVSLAAPAEIAAGRVWPYWGDAPLALLLLPLHESAGAEHLHLLAPRRVRVAAAAKPSPGKTATLAKLDAVLADFTWQRGQKPGPHADHVKRANAAILESTRIILPP